MNPMTNATVDNLIQWLAQSQQPLPPPRAPFPLSTDTRSVAVEALLAGDFAVAQPRRSAAQNSEASRLLQFLQSGLDGANQPFYSVASQARYPSGRRSTSPFVTTPVASLRVKKKELNQRQEFFVLVKLLFRVLKDNQDMDRLVHVKAIIAECTHRNRSGDMAFSNLRVSVESRLRRTVGEVYWSQAKELTERVRRSRGNS